MNGRDERGQILVVFAIMLPVFIALGGLVIGIGNWYTHAKHLQTKADAGALAGGGVWGFPCGPDTDANIENLARTYVGPHIKADGTPFAGTTYNPQIGQVTGSQVHVVLNGSGWFDDDNPPPGPADRSDPSNASICDSKTLDVKATEDNSFPLFSLVPIFPDIKRKARVEIQQIEGLSGVLPIAVRVPRPLSAAAVFYSETSGNILDVKYFCEKPNGFTGLPAGLSGWTTFDTSATPDPLCSSWASVNVGSATGVVVATSFRPACGTGNPPATAPCLEDSGWGGQPVNNFCQQASGAVQCWDATGQASSQAVQAGVQFIRGYSAAGTSAPELRSAHLDGAPAACGGAYFVSLSTACSARLNVSVDISGFVGTYPNPSPPPAQTTQPLRASDVQVRYRLVRSNGAAFCNYGNNCEVLPNIANATGTPSFSTTGSGISPHLPIPPDSHENAVAIEVQLRNASGGGLPAACSNSNFNNNCRWFFTGSPGNFGTSVAPSDTDILNSPVQRAFSGSLDRTGSLKWLRMTADTSSPCDGTPDLGLSETAGAASVPAGIRCFYLEMGLQGGIARDQDEPPIAFNLGTTGSQRALIDCDDAPGSNLATEIQNGCGPRYATHQFTYTPECPPVNSINGLLGAHPAPWNATNGWPPAGGTRCVITQTGASNQIIPGFNQRLFGVQNNPTCPADSAAGYVRGRNYWHDNNNLYDGTTFAETIPTLVHGNNIKSDDPRLVTLFFTEYDSFAAPGNEPYAIVGFGAFYVTGYGRTTGGGGSWQGGAPEDPCTGGNSGNPLDGMPFGVGNEPPPDLNLSANQTWVWGHFVNPVLLTSNANPSGVLCAPGQSFQPCVAVLVE